MASSSNSTFTNDQTDLVTIFPEIKSDSENFRINNRRLFLTYKTHIDKNIIRDFFSSLKPEELYIAHENSDSRHPYNHTHVYIHFPKAFQTRSARRLDINKIHPHIRKVLSNKHTYNIYRYLSKEDKSNLFLLDKIPQDSDESVADKVWACKSKTEALRLAKTPQEASGISLLYDNKPRINKPTQVELYEWQKYLHGELMSPPDPRKIIWYVDFLGCCGKSYFCKYRAVTFNDALLTQVNNTRDIATVIDNALKTGWNEGALLVDLPRSAPNDENLYQTLEMVKNGTFNTLKYQGRVVVFDTPHVVVFSNFYPDISLMSLDRWDVRDITPYDNNPSTLTPKSVSLNHIANNIKPAFPANMPKNIDKIKLQNASGKSESPTNVTTIKNVTVPIYIAK